MTTLAWFLFAIFIQHAPVCAQKYAIYDADTQFTSSELYMAKDCDPAGCANHKHFSAITNPTGIPVLSDAYDVNNRCYELYFPECQYSASHNFCRKCMSQPSDQRGFPLGAFTWHAFSIFVPADFSHRPKWSVVYQFHDHPDTVGICDHWQSPSFAIGINSASSWIFYGRHNAQKCDRGGRSETAFSVAQPIAKGNWTHFVIHIRFDYSGGGRCEVWQKDAQKTSPVKVLDYSGPLGCNDDVLPYDYVSFGYYYGPANPGTGILRLYYDRIIFGGTDETLESMMYHQQSGAAVDKNH